MIITRRGFIGTCLALGVAPMLAVRSKGSGILVPSRELLVPRSAFEDYFDDPSILEKYENVLVTGIHINVRPEMASIEVTMEFSNPKYNTVHSARMKNPAGIELGDTIRIPTRRMR